MRLGCPSVRGKTHEAVERKGTGSALSITAGRDTDCGAMSAPAVDSPFAGTVTVAPSPCEHGRAAIHYVTPRPRQSEGRVLNESHRRQRSKSLGAIVESLSASDRLYGRPSRVPAVCHPQVGLGQDCSGGTPSVRYTRRGRGRRDRHFCARGPAPWSVRDRRGGGGSP